MSRDLEIYLTTKYLPSTHYLMNADMTMTVLKVLTQSLGKGTYTKQVEYILQSRNTCVMKPWRGVGREGGSSVEFCGFQRPGNLQR